MLNVKLLMENGMTHEGLREKIEGSIDAKIKCQGAVIRQVAIVIRDEGNQKQFMIRKEQDKYAKEKLCLLKKLDIIGSVN